MKIMKKILFSMVCLMMMGVQGVKAQMAKIILHHQGAISVYTSNQTTDVLDAAVDGDTIYFNDGGFSGDVTICKKITMIGAGDNRSTIKGSVTVSIGEGSETLTSQLLEGINISGSLNVNKSTKGLAIRKCSFNSISFDASTEDCVIDRCYCSGFNLSENTKSIIVNNSVIERVYGTAPSAEGVLFNNCNLYVNSGSCLATYRNCIIMGWGDSSSYPTTTYINCLCSYNYYEYGVNYGCWAFGKDILKADYSCVLTSTELLEKGYVGTDGKVVGYNGGETPYTLTVNSPKITDYSSSVDPESRKVTISLKVTNK